MRRLCKRLGKKPGLNGDYQIDFAALAFTGSFSVDNDTPSGGFNAQLRTVCDEPLMTP